MKHSVIKQINFSFRFSLLVLTASLLNPVHAIEQTTIKRKVLLKAAQIFDGTILHTNAAVLLTGNIVTAVGDPTALQSKNKTATIVDLGNSTIMPGFIELHGHIAFQNLPHKTILEHGITTVRDVGGPLLAPSGGDGSLRLLTSGPIITTSGGYPIPVFGTTNIAAPVDTAEQARQQVRDLIAGGAAVIKIGLDPGGEAGAPWMEHGNTSTPAPWAMPSLEVVQAVTDEAHKAGKLVAAHVAENQGVTMSLDAGVDEWAHVPCMPIDDALLQRAVQQKVKVITTIDALSHCSGIHQNATKLASFGAEFLYGAEIAHVDIPWGIDAQELHFMMHLTGMSASDIFHTATAKAGEYLGLAPLGTLTKGAPADLIAVRGNPFMNFKLLEYPDMVMSGGKLIVNKYSNQPIIFK